MKKMNAAAIADLNAAYEAAMAQSSEQSPHIATHEVALAAGLIVVRADDESGVLYRTPTGEYVYGWGAGGFDDQID